MSHAHFDFVLREARFVTPRVRELTFERADGAPLVYVPGQFVTLHIPHPEKLLRRSYSIATMPGTSDGISIAVAHVEGGRATRFLFDMEPGEKVEASGPFGRFVLRDDPPCRYLLIATGTGVTPYRSMLPELAGKLEKGACTAELLLGVRSRAELLYGDEFIAFAERHPGFRFHACYSREMPLDPRPWEHRGYVQDVLATMTLDPQRDIAYVCGNPDMIDAVAARLKDAGFPLANVRREKYVSSN
ncbi:MAG TPA: FAD-binding oxidoreductase [Gammaproteobacteria bacterium]|nr:FAD-binding oxidoreductase [Gammaproteobacteria bacterium]